MAVTTTKSEGLSSEQERSVETGAANTALTASLTGRRRRLLAVTVKYSGAPTQAGVTVTLNNGAGAAYDAVLSTGSANAQTTIFLPNLPIPLLADDAIDVLAPAGGVGITAAVAIYSEPYG